MQSTTEEIHAFIQDNMPLMKLCFMEYALNFLVDNAPVERRLLLPGDGTATGTATYESICVAMCDNFRQESVVTGRESWEQMSATALASIERCIRICKFRMLRVKEPVTRISVASENFHASAMHMRFMYGDVLGLHCMHPERTGDEVFFAGTLQKNVSVHPLPLQVRREQVAALWQMLGGCFRSMENRCYFSFCVLCALNGRLCKTKMRMCSVTRQLSCTTCPAGTVVRVKMLGVCLKICSTNYYMCPCCARICVWHADGYDLCPGLVAKQEEGCGGVPAGGEAGAGDREVETGNDVRARILACGEGVGCSCLCGGSGAAPLLVTEAEKVREQCFGAAPTHDVCFTCRNKNVVRSATVLLPDLKGKVMRPVHSCSKHVLPEHMMRNVYNTADMTRAVVAQQQQQGGGSGRGRR